MAVVGGRDEGGKWTVDSGRWTVDAAWGGAEVDGEGFLEASPRLAGLTLLSRSNARRTINGPGLRKHKKNTKFNTATARHTHAQTHSSL